MITNSDLKSDGFAAGSSTEAEDWKDWNKPAMSRDNAKLLRKRTCTTLVCYQVWHEWHSTDKVRNRGVEEYKKAILLRRTFDTVDTCSPCYDCPNRRVIDDKPSKSSATMRHSSVGVTDIQTPSVVLIAEPANDVSARWFKAKLLPTDCSPIRKLISVCKTL